VKIAHYLAPDGAPIAFQTLAGQFPALVAEFADVEVLKQGQLPHVTPNIITYSMDVQPEAMQRFPWAIHIQPFVDGDFAPTPGVIQVFPSCAYGVLHGKQHNVPGHPLVIPNWVYPELWPMGGGGDYVAYVGRLWPAKMGPLNAIIEAMPDVQFIVAGEGRWFKQGQRNVEYVGQVPQAEVARILRGSRAVLCPSQYCEPFGMSAVEAGLSGARVIASKLGAFQETLPPDAQLVSPTALDEWIAAIRAPDAMDRAGRRSHHMQLHAPQLASRRYKDLFTQFCHEQRA
jgi:glycosyltransferase involved in cell wall biosynthesis